MFVSGLHLPPEISFEKQFLPHGVAFVFRHQDLGQIGRIVMLEAANGSTCIECETAGDPADPMTARRAEIMEPLGLELTDLLGTAVGGTRHVDRPQISPKSPAPSEVVESQLVPCGRCGAALAMLIYAPGATDAGRFEDCARKMYSTYTGLNIPTWIIGPALGRGALMDRPADMLKVWPKRERIQRLTPQEFNRLMHKLTIRHCT